MLSVVPPPLPVRAIRESNLDLEGYFYSKSKELYVYLR